MSKRTNERILFAIGLAVFITGIVLVTGVARALAKGRIQIDRTIGFSGELKMLDTQFTSLRDADAQFHAARSTQASELDKLLAEHLTSSMTESRSEKRREISPTWTIRDLTITFPDVPFGNVMSLVHAAESLRPPWRLTACELMALSGAPGRGKAGLTFSTFEYKP